MNNHNGHIRTHTCASTSAGMITMEKRNNLKRIEDLKKHIKEIESSPILNKSLILQKTLESHKKELKKLGGL